jgi:hypothetical protein
MLEKDTINRLVYSMVKAARELEKLDKDIKKFFIYCDGIDEPTRIDTIIEILYEEVFQLTGMKRNKRSDEDRHNEFTEDLFSDSIEIDKFIECYIK